MGGSKEVVRGGGGSDLDFRCLMRRAQVWCGCLVVRVGIFVLVASVGSGCREVGVVMIPVRWSNECRGTLD